MGQERDSKPELCSQGGSRSPRLESVPGVTFVTRPQSQPLGTYRREEDKNLVTRRRSLGLKAGSLERFLSTPVGTRGWWARNRARPHV